MTKTVSSSCFFSLTGVAIAHGAGDSGGVGILTATVNRLSFLFCCQNAISLYQSNDLFFIFVVCVFRLHCTIMTLFPCFTAHEFVTMTTPYPHSVLRVLSFCACVNIYAYARCVV